MVGIVLKDLQRTRLSRCCKIWLLAHPTFPPPPFARPDRQHTGRLGTREKLLTGEGGGKRVGEEPNHAKPGPL
jgi:hypothetical protein